MQKRHIEYFYSTHSAFAYLGAPRLMEICRDYDCTLIHRPINLSPVVEYAGGLPFAQRTQAHVDYFFGREIERWAAFRGLPIINHRPTHHDNALNLSSGMLIAAEQQGHSINHLSFALLRAHWRDDINLADQSALAAVASETGLDPVPLFDRALSKDVQQVFENNTKIAMDRQIFGSPTYFLDGDMFYGQDRLELLAHALETPFPKASFQNPNVNPRAPG